MFPREIQDRRRCYCAKPTENIRELLTQLNSIFPGVVIESTEYDLATDLLNIYCMHEDFDRLTPGCYIPKFEIPEEQ